MHNNTLFNIYKSFSIITTFLILLSHHITSSFCNGINSTIRPKKEKYFNTWSCRFINVTTVKKIVVWLVVFVSTCVMLNANNNGGLVPHQNLRGGNFVAYAEPPTMSQRMADTINRRRSHEKSNRLEGDTGCLVSQVQCNPSKTVHIIKFDWLSSAISAELAKIVLEEQLGICVEVVTMRNVTQALDEMSRYGDQTYYAILEFWRQTRKSLYE